MNRELIARRLGYTVRLLDGRYWLCGPDGERIAWANYRSRKMAWHSALPMFIDVRSALEHVTAGLNRIGYHVTVSLTPTGIRVALQSARDERESRWCSDLGTLGTVLCDEFLAVTNARLTWVSIDGVPYMTLKSWPAVLKELPSGLPVDTDADGRHHLRFSNGWAIYSEYKTLPTVMEFREGVINDE